MYVITHTGFNQNGVILFHKNITKVTEKQAIDYYHEHILPNVALFDLAQIVNTETMEIIKQISPKGRY